MIRIALQNNGRLTAESLEYLRRCGLEFNVEGRNLIVPCENCDVELLLVRSADIPLYLQYGVADFGIVGKNVLLEQPEQFEVVRSLGFGKCSMVLAVPKDCGIENLEELNYERIATSYPRILKAQLKERNIKATIIDIQGSVEIAPALGLAEAVFDLTQTGNTLAENGLKILEKMVESEAVLIKKFTNKFNYENLFI